MSGLYLRASAGSPAICQRCHFKTSHDALVQEPVTGMWVCARCCDEKDPWLLPARKPENITLAHPRPDEELA